IASIYLRGVDLPNQDISVHQLLLQKASDGWVKTAQVREPNDKGRLSPKNASKRIFSCVARGFNIFPDERLAKRRRMSCQRCRRILTQEPVHEMLIRHEERKVFNLLALYVGSDIVCYSIRKWFVSREALDQCTPFCSSCAKDRYNDQSGTKEKFSPIGSQ